MTDLDSLNGLKSKTTYKPDILTCLANLSNDEVFTPPALANEVLDLLPQELFENPNTKFLDPVCKSGVFLREITRRLMKGLEKQIPNEQKRRNHIFTKQLYGIAITELTAQMSRRSVYCSKEANSKYSVCTEFKNVDGNIKFTPMSHTFKNGNCIYCGASESEYGEKVRSKLESHAYEFIHMTCEQEKEYREMKFDVIIGNPPYQFGVGNLGGNSSKSRAIYHFFIRQAQKLQPRYLCMITPSRWMTRSVEGIPIEWIDAMISDKRFLEIHDFLDASEIFPGTPPKAGVNYFLWSRDYNGKCKYYVYKTASDKTPLFREDYLNSDKVGIVIREINALSIIEKIKKVELDYLSDENKNFSGLVSPKDFFTNKETLTSSWSMYKMSPNDTYTIKCYLNRALHKRDFGWVKITDISKNRDAINLHKVLIPAAGGSGTDTQVLGFPFYSEPNSVCSQTYLVIGYKHRLTKGQCENIISYITTRFFRFLVSIKKKTQNGPRKVYQFVPMQDFSQSWTDAELYKKYGLTQSEIDFIESMVRPMDANTKEAVVADGGDDE